ncbi:MAG TPA: hypothetical protein VH540_12565, partial [Ktedonobacterales bacterium]
GRLEVLRLQMGMLKPQHTEKPSSSFVGWSGGVPGVVRTMLLPSPSLAPATNRFVVNTRR